MKMDLQPFQNSVEQQFDREENAYGIKISTEGIFVYQNFDTHTCEWFNDVPAEGMVYRTALLPLIQLIQTKVANLTAIRKRENEQAEAILGK